MKGPYIDELCDGGIADVVMVSDSPTMYGFWDEFWPGVKVANRGIGNDVSEGLFNRMDTVVQGEPVEGLCDDWDGRCGMWHTTGKTVGYVRQVLKEMRAD